MPFFDANSTFAWYSATNAATVNASATSASVTTKASTVSAVTYYVKVTYGGAALTQVSLTDKNGNSWASVGGYLRAATGATPYGTLSGTAGDYSVTIHATSDGAALAGGDLATALANLKADGTDYNVTATGSDYVRMTLTDPSSSFSTAFGSNIHNKVTIGQLSFDSGSPVLSSFVASYYSVSGNTGNTIPTAGSAEAEWIPADQSITISIEAIVPAP